MRRWLTAVCWLLLAMPAFAADRRVPVDPNDPPWNAVAKVQSNIGGRCSGVLIAPATVLTAAHCLYNPHTRALLQPVSLHVLFGYQRGEYRWHRLVRSYTTGKNFDWLWRFPQASDWAQLVLTEPIPVTPLPVATKLPPPGTAVTFAGYNQDKAQLPMIDPACHLQRTFEETDGSMWLNHDCAGTFGTSGGPLLARQGNGWAVIGIAVVVGQGRNVALLPPPAELRSTAP